MNIRIVKERDPLAEAFAKSLETIESQVERRKLSVVEELLQFMKREGIHRSELAARMGVPPSRINTATLSQEGAAESFWSKIIGPLQG
ncbi:MAG: hypothetical protein ACLFRP_02425 [Puniceicoccaceae bacterium]